MGINADGVLFYGIAFDNDIEDTWKDVWSEWMIVKIGAVEGEAARCELCGALGFRQEDNRKADAKGINGINKH